MEAAQNMWASLFHQAPAQGQQPSKARAAAKTKAGHRTSTRQNSPSALQCYNQAYTGEVDLLTVSQMLMRSSLLSVCMYLVVDAAVGQFEKAWTWVSRRARFRPAAAARQSSQPQPRPTVAVHAPTASPRSSTAQQPAMPVSATQTTRLPPQPQRQTVNVSSEQRAIGQGRTTGQHTQVLSQQPSLTAGVGTGMQHLFLCPITHEVVTNPVMAADGYTYERTAIATWLSSHNTSPVTNTTLPNRSLIPNHSLRSAIQEHISRSARRAN